MAQCWYTPPLSNRVATDIPYHETLSACGIWFPGCDAADAATYLAQGDLLSAGISALSIVPFGDFLKLIRRAKPALRGVDEAMTVARDAYRYTPDQGIPVIGSRAHVAKFAGMPGVAVLNNLPDWSITKNLRWIDSIAEHHASVFVATERAAIDASSSGVNDVLGLTRATMLQVEIQALRGLHGYQWSGSWLVPPGLK